MGIINANKVLLNENNESTSITMNYHRVTEVHINDNMVNFQVLGYENQQAFENGSGHLKREYFSYPKNSTLDLFSEIAQKEVNTSITTLIEDELIKTSQGLTQEQTNLRFIGFLENGTKI